MSNFDIEYDCLKNLVHHNNINYINEHLNIKRPPKKVQFYQILKCIDVVDIIKILFYHNKLLAAHILAMENNGASAESNFDVYFPYYLQRDFLVKELLKATENISVKEPAIFTIGKECKFIYYWRHDGKILQIYSHEDNKPITYGKCKDGFYRLKKDDELDKEFSISIEEMFSIESHKVRELVCT